jgi:predicted phage-related endonuclease
MGGKEPDCANVQDVLIKLNRHTDSKVIEVGDEIMQAYNQLKDVRAEISKLEEQKEALEAKLKMGFGDAEAISYGGNTLATWKAGKDSEKFDAKAFQADHPELARQYTKSVKSSRRFLLK